MAELPPVQRLVLVALASHLPTIRPSMRGLAAETGYNTRTIQRTLIELREAGYLSWVSGAPQARLMVANLYTIEWLAIPERAPRDRRSLLSEANSRTDQYAQQVLDLEARSGLTRKPIHLCAPRPQTPDLWAESPQVPVGTESTHLWAESPEPWAESPLDPWAESPRPVGTAPTQASTYKLYPAPLTLTAAAEQARTAELTRKQEPVPRHAAAEAADAWQRIGSTLQAKTPTQSFDTFLKPVRGLSLVERVLTVSVPTIDFLPYFSTQARNIAEACRLWEFAIDQVQAVPIEGYEKWLARQMNLRSSQEAASARKNYGAELAAKRVRRRSTRQ